MNHFTIRPARDAPRGARVSRAAGRRVAGDPLGFYPNSWSAGCAGEGMRRGAPGSQPVATGVALVSHFAFPRGWRGGEWAGLHADSTVRRAQCIARREYGVGQHRTLPTRPWFRPVPPAGRAARARATAIPHARCACSEGLIGVCGKLMSPPIVAFVASRSRARSVPPPRARGALTDSR